MTEFAPNWPGWDFKVAPNGLSDAMVDPDGGVALVEIDDSPQALLSDMQVVYDPPQEPSNYMKTYVYFEAPDGVHIPNLNQDLSDVFPELKNRFHTLTQALRLVMDPVRVALDAEPDLQSLRLIISKRLEQKGHSDPSLLRAWVGATHPGFFLVRDGQKLPIDSLPEGHVLLIRGAD